MSRQQTLRRSVAALAVASLIAGTPLAVAGPAAASGYRDHGSSYFYSYRGYRPQYGSSYRDPYGYGPSYGYGHHDYRYSRYRPPHHGHSGVGIGVHGHGSDAALAVAALGAGLLLGHFLTRPQGRAPDRVNRPSAPAFGYGKQVRRDCKATTGSGLYRGRRALFGGTFCYDAQGRGYIVPGSEYVIGYAN